MLGDVQVCSGSDNEVFTLVSKLKSEEPTADIFILSRTNEGLTPFRDLAKKKQATLLTMHRAKGLEADYVIVKGDCNYTNTSPVRNAIYAITGMGTSYDQSQLDESLRLAYVAITRAKKKVYWFGDNEKPGGAFSLLCGTLVSDLRGKPCRSGRG